jgi:hypothetical protein
VVDSRCVTNALIKSAMRTPSSYNG